MVVLMKIHAAGLEEFPDNRKGAAAGSMRNGLRVMCLDDSVGQPRLGQICELNFPADHPVPEIGSSHFVEIQEVQRVFAGRAVFRGRFVADLTGKALPEQRKAGK